MSPLYYDCKMMLVASEIGVISNYFNEWLDSHVFTKRTTHNRLMRELNEFRAAMSKCYHKKSIDGSIFETQTMERHFDNALNEMLKEGLDDFYDFTKNAIDELGNDRITVDKLRKAVDVFVHDSFVDMMNSIDKGSLW